MGNIVHANRSNFETEVLAADLPVLVDFWAEWCPPCRKLGPTLEQVAVALDGRLKVVKINVQEAGELATHYGVINIPTMIIFKDGQEITRIVGNRSKDSLIQELTPYL